MKAKPPIGVIPHKVWMLMRKREIVEAIDSYCDAELTIPERFLEDLKKVDRMIEAEEKEEQGE